MEQLAEIPLEAVGIGSGWALVVLFVVMFFRGKIHTDAEVQRMVVDHQRLVADLIHDRDEWRAEGRLKDQQIDEQGIQLRYLAEVGKTVQAVLNAVHQLARSGGSQEESTS